jgi:hypothetical protein
MHVYTRLKQLCTLQGAGVKQEKPACLGHKWHIL